MTQNQISFWKNQIDRDIGLKQLEETHRSNVAKEAETQRANLAKERLTQLADIAKYGRTKYNPHALEEVGQSAELFDTSKEVLDWILGLVLGGFGAKGGKR